jgi:hypothetical protein
MAASKCQSIAQKLPGRIANAEPQQCDALRAADLRFGRAGSLPTQRTRYRRGIYTKAQWGVEGRSAVTAAKSGAYCPTRYLPERASRVSENAVGR